MKALQHRLADLAALGLASIALACALLVPSPAAAADAADERSAIATERTAAEASFVARGKACRERFAVSGCVEDARRERRITLDALRARQLVIDEARRKERATTRRAELASRAADDARREQERAARSATAASAASAPRVGKPFEARRDAREASPRSPGAPQERGVAGGHRPAAKPLAPSLGAGERQAREARSKAAYEARQRKAAAHREQAIAAAVKRMEQHAPARSLPLPAR